MIRFLIGGLPSRGGHETSELSVDLDPPRPALTHNNSQTTLSGFASSGVSPHKSSMEPPRLPADKKGASTTSLALCHAFLGLWNLIKTTAFFAKSGTIVGEV